jgi:PAS domain-containing protein
MRLLTSGHKNPMMGDAGSGTSMATMPTETHFLPVGRLALPRILEETTQVGESPVLMAMLDSSPGMIALLNPQRQIVYCNEAFVKAGGLASKGDALGLRPGELLQCIHAKEMPGGCGTSSSCCHCGLAQGLVAGQQGRANSGECLLQCHDDKRNISAEYAVEVRPVPKIGIGWQCFSLTDISSERRREALERTFYHDVMNRACAVKSISDVLVRDDIAPEARSDFMGMLSVSAHALVDEIQSQCTLHAAEKGDLAVKMNDCDSREALESAVAACRAFGFAEDKHVEVLPGTQSIVFRTDATLLGRILINLLKNALEAGDADTIVTATCRAVSVPRRVRLSVHNDAVMPEKVRAHVFQRSFSTKGTGRGLGTYSVKLLTESMGGRVWFDSNAGEGTTFHVEFDI